MSVADRERGYYYPHGQLRPVEGSDQRPSNGLQPDLGSHSEPERQRIHQAIRWTSGLFIVFLIILGMTVFSIPVSQAQRTDLFFNILIILFFYLVTVVFFLVMILKGEAPKPPRRG